jgi:hypothetical protein
MDLLVFLARTPAGSAKMIIETVWERRFPAESV